MAASYMHCNNHIFWHADLTRTYMPPKKIRAAARRYGVRNGLEEKEVRRIDSGNLGKGEEQRDSPFSFDTRNNLTTPQASLRASKSSAPLSPSSQVQVLKFLLSPAALPPASTQPNSRTYSDLLTPFEELLAAVILSRPVPHRLALNIISTLLNAPYSFRNAVAIKTAGPRRIRQALDDAGMQHGDEEIDILFEALCNNNWHNDLNRLRTHARNPIAAQRENLRRSIAGLAPGGLDIFFRRVQWQWPEIYPFIDAGAQDALAYLALPRRAEGLERMIEVRWQELGREEGSAEGIDEGLERKKAFVVLCERAREFEYEGRLEEVIEAARR
jgi:hypothetical protein